MTKKKGELSDPLEIDCVIGLGLSVRLGICPLELVDFVIGWTTIDMFQDDAMLDSKSKLDSHK